MKKIVQAQHRALANPKLRMGNQTDGTIIYVNILIMLFELCCFTTNSLGSVIRVVTLSNKTPFLIDSNTIYIIVRTAALHVLQTGKMISQLLKACQTLELSTQLSRRCCDAFAK